MLVALAGETANRRMKNLIVLTLLGFLAWYAYGKYRALAAPEPAMVAPAATTHAPRAVALPAPAAAPGAPEFTCDGRTYCSQMRSCAEATYFAKYCPNTKMDGNHDGVPCERQWCG
jgi:hypothetical protein